MDELCLQDRIHWGMNRAARSIGMPTDAYRPSGPLKPLQPANRFLRLHAAFCNVRGGFERPIEYDHPLWSGIFDAAYTRVGDYLVQPNGTWFVAAQQPLLPVLSCTGKSDHIVLAGGRADSQRREYIWRRHCGDQHASPDKLARQRSDCLASRKFCGRFARGRPCDLLDRPSACPSGRRPTPGRPDDR